MNSPSSRTSGRFASAILIAGLFLGACGSSAKDGDPQEGFGRAEPVPPSYFGIHLHFAGKGTTQPPDIGATTWRLWDTYTGWKGVEPRKGEWDFRLLDKTVSVAESHHAELIMTFGVTPQWAAMRPDEPAGYGPGSASELKSLDDYRDYVRETATRYKGRIHLYEVWNEPDLKNFYTGSPETMVAMTRIACTEIKAVDPNNKVLSPPPSSGSPYALAWYRKYLSALGPDACFDIQAWHFYTAESSPEAVVDAVHKARALSAEMGLRPMPMWNTESGYFIENDTGQPVRSLINIGGKLLLGRDQAANYVARALMLAWAAGLDRYYWYAWDDPKMGLMNFDSGIPKPAGKAYKAVQQWMIGSTITDCHSDGGVWSCKLARGGRTAYAVWAEQGSLPWSIPENLRIRGSQDLAGLQGKVSAPSMTVGESPVLLLSDSARW